MKKILKRISCVFILSLLIAMTMVATAYAESPGPVYISNGEELKDLLENGGEGIFTQDINSFSDVDMVRIPEGTTVSIDMNGYSLKMNIRRSLILDGNICFYNGTGIALSIERCNSENGTIAIKDTTANIWGHVFNRFLLVNSPDSIIEHTATSPIIVTDSKNAMTNEQFIEMVKSGILPQPEAEGYLFTEWRDQADNVVTEWKAEGVTEIKSVWEKDIKIAFDTDGGICDTESVRPMDNGKLKSIPAAKKDGACFDGWLTESGDKVTMDTIFSKSTTLKASWVEESARAEALAECMDEQGFSQSSIDRHIGMLSNGMAASIFGMGNLWMVIALVFILVSVVLGVIIVKKK